MNRDQKAAVVEEIAGQIEAARAIFAVDYRGISVAQVADLRARLRESETKFRIVKNSLSERAADKAGALSLKPMLEGPTALALVGGDAALAAKALNDMARALNVLDFKGGLMDGAELTADDVRAIARLPARDVLHAQLVGAIASPISGLVRTLNALIAGLAIQLQAIADQGLVSGQAPPAATEPEAPLEPETEAPAEPEAAAEPEPEAAAEPEPEPPEAAGEPEAAQPEPEGAAEPEPVPPGAPEPVAGAEPEPEAAAHPEPDEPKQASEQPEADATETEESEA